MSKTNIGNNRERSHKKLFQFDFTSCIINNFIVKKICENYSVQFHQFLICMFVSFHFQYWRDREFDETRDVNVYGRELIWKQYSYFYVFRAHFKHVSNTICIHWVKGQHTNISIRNEHEMIWCAAAEEISISKCSEIRHDLRFN